MPPLNRYIEDEGNDDALRFSNSSQDQGRRDSFDIVLEKPAQTTSILKLLVVSERRIRFVDQLQVRSISGLGNYSEQEIQDCWYSATDFAAFRQEVHNTLYNYNKNPTRIDGIEYTMRGLEHHLENLPSTRSLLRMRVRMIVLDGQVRKEGVGDANVERLATLCSVVSRDTVNGAVSMASLDQLSAIRYQMEPANEPFNDDWISCISSMDTNPRYMGYTKYEERTGVLNDVAGFDDSWLHDLAGIP